MITIRKIYQQIHEGERIDSIVAYACRPYERVVKEGDEGRYTVTSKWKKMLKIDLWLVVLDFEWIKVVDTGKYPNVH